MVDEKTNNLKNMSGEEKDKYLLDILSNIPDLSILDMDMLKAYVSTLPADTDKRMKCFEALAWVFSENEKGPLTINEGKMMEELNPDVLKACKAYNSFLNSLFNCGADGSAFLQKVKGCEFTDDNKFDFVGVDDDLKARLFIRCGDGEFRAVFPDLLPPIPNEGLLGELVRVRYPLGIDPMIAPDEYKDAYYKYLSLIEEARKINGQITEKAEKDGLIKEAE